MLCVSVSPPRSVSDYLSSVFTVSVVSVVLGALCAFQLKPRHFPFKEFSCVLFSRRIVKVLICMSCIPTGDFPKHVVPSWHVDDPFRSNIIRLRFLQCISSLCTVRAGLCNGWSKNIPMIVRSIYLFVF